MRGQAAFEYMFLMGVLFVILAAAFAYGSQASVLSVRTSQAAEAVRSVAAAADRLYKLGGGNSTVVVDIPSGTVNQTVSGKAVMLTLSIGGSTGDALAVTAGNVTGALPTAQGRYVVVVETLSSGIVRVRPL